MMLAAGGFADDLGVSPAQTAEVIGQGDAGKAGRCGRTAAFADGNVILNSKRQRNNSRPLRLEYLAIRVEDEVVLDALADFLVASAGGNGEALRRASLDGDVEVHRQGSGIESRA